MKKERLRFKVGDRFCRSYFPDQKGTIFKINPPYNDPNPDHVGVYYIYAHMDGNNPNTESVLFQSGIKKIKA